MHGRLSSLIAAICVLAITPGCITFQPDVRAPQRPAAEAVARPALPVSAALVLPDDLVGFRQRIVMSFAGDLPVGATVAQQLTAACARMVRHCEAVRSAAQATAVDIVLLPRLEGVDFRQPPIPLMNWEVTIEMIVEARLPDGRSLARERLSGTGTGTALSGLTIFDSGAAAVANAAADLVARLEQGFATWPGVSSWLASREERQR